MGLRNGVVVTPQPLASEAGVEILKAGGNAFDAAVATAFVQTVVDPQMCGIAGFGAAHCYRAIDRHAEIIAFYDKAPQLAREDMYEPVDADEVFGDYFPAKNHENQLGYKSVSTPGSLRGYWEVHESYGRMPWREVLEPAIRLSREGFRLHPDQTGYWRQPQTLGNIDNLTKLTATDACAAIYTKNGELFDDGDWLVNPDYANTLERIAAEGPDIFYHGEIAQEIGGHGGMDTIMTWRLIDCLRNGIPLDMNVYDTASWSSVIMLSEWSVANESTPIHFPDFTAGAWKTNEPNMDIKLVRGGTTQFV